MKTENTFPQLVYEDTKFKEQTRSEIQAAKTALQNLLNEWNSLGLPAITDYKELFKLVHVPQRVYSDTVHSMSPEPVSHGSFAIAPNVNVKITDAPVPNQLYVRAREAKMQIQNGRMQLWSIENDTIILNETEAEALCDSMDVYAENIEQKKFIEAAISYRDSGNYLHDVIINGTSLTFQHSTPFEIVERHGGNILKVDISPDALRAMVKEL
jgi:hypothetical protein